MGREHKQRAHCCFDHSPEYEAFKGKYRIDTIATVLGKLNRTHASWIMDYKFTANKSALENPKTVFTAFVSQACEAATNMAKGNVNDAMLGLCNAALLYTFMDQHNDKALGKVVDQVISDTEGYIRGRDDVDDVDEGDDSAE